MSDDLRTGLRLSYISIVWTVGASSTSVVLGLLAPSFVLVAFGLTGLLDAAGSTALAAHFRHALRHESSSDARERIAHRIVSIGLLITAAATAIESVRRLAAGTEAHRSPVGAVTAGASVAVLGWLAARKRSVALRLDSDALLADSWLSATGALLGVVAAAGAVLAGADAVFALVIAVGAGVLGQRELRASRR